MTFTHQMIKYCIIEPEVSKEKAPEPKPEPAKKGENVQFVQN